jgi:hypothetical protein
MLHMVRTGYGARYPYIVSWVRHRQAHDAADQQTADFARPRCPDCCGTELIPYTPAYRNAVLFAVLSTHANLD